MAGECVRGGVVGSVFSAFFRLFAGGFWLAKRAGNIGCCELNRVMVPLFWIHLIE